MWDTHPTDMTLPEFPDERRVSYPESSQATTVLVPGIVGLIFSIVAPVAWIMARQELRAIEEGRRDPANQSTANIGKVLGIIGTIFLILGLVAAVLVVVFLFAGTEGGVFGTLT